MPGSNHEMETVFFNSLQQDEHEVAIELLHNYYLKDMIIFYETGVPEKLRKQYQKTPEQWQIITKKVLLTKLSYFTPSSNMSFEQLDFLSLLTSKIFNQPQENVTKIHHRLKTTHPFFSTWLKNLENFRSRKH